MLLNKALVAQVKDRIRDTTTVTPFSSEIVKRLDEAAADFVLAPDEFLDVARLPGTVTDLDTLFAYLKTIQGKLATRDNKVKTEDLEVAKSGELKCYKTYVCGIHALSGYIHTSPDFNMSAAEFCNKIAAWSSKNPPEGLGKGGATLWDKTFGETNPRILAVLKSLIYFCDTVPAAQTTLIVSTPPASPPLPPLGGSPPPSISNDAVVQLSTVGSNDAVEESKVE